MRFGTTDYSSLERMQDNFKGINEAVTTRFQQELEAKKQALSQQMQLGQLENTVRQQKAIQQILEGVAEATKDKDVPKQTLKNVPNVSIGPNGMPTGIGFAPQDIPAHQRPASPQEYNRAIDTGALKLFGIPGGEKAAEHLYRYREALNPHLSFTEQLSMAQLKHLMDMEKVKAQQAGATARTGMTVEGADKRAEAGIKSREKLSEAQRKQKEENLKLTFPSYPVYNAYGKFGPEVTEKNLTGTKKDITSVIQKDMKRIDDMIQKLPESKGKEKGTGFLGMFPSAEVISWEQFKKGNIDIEQLPETLRQMASVWSQLKSIQMDAESAKPEEEPEEKTQEGTDNTSSTDDSQGAPAGGWTYTIQELRDAWGDIVKDMEDDQIRILAKANGYKTNN